MPILSIRTMKLKVQQLTQGPADSKNAAGTNLTGVVLHGGKEKDSKATSGIISLM